MTDQLIARAATPPDVSDGTQIPRLRRPGLLQVAALTWRCPQFMARCRRDLGPTFVVPNVGGGDFVFTSDAEAIRTLFHGAPLEKRHGNDLLRPFVGDRSVLTLEPAEHLVRRKLLMAPFHGDAVKRYAEQMAALVEESTDTWRHGDVVAIHPWAQQLTLQVIFGAVLGMDDEGLRRRLTETFTAMVHPALAVGLFVPQLLEGDRNPLGKRWRRLRGEMDAIVYEQIRSTRSDPRLEDRTDVLARLVQVRDEDGIGFDDETLRDEVVTLLSAGHETTATAIAWAFDLLVHHPEELAAARTAARSGDDDHLDAVAKEVLRIRPPVPIGGARVLLEPTRIGPYTVPAGANVAVDGLGVHYDPQRYPDPHRLQATRFAEGHPAAVDWVPFGGGAHRCLGAAMALLEIRAALGGVLRRFRPEAVSPPARARRRGVTLTPANRARIRLD